jgi:hypothetical protein
MFYDIIKTAESDGRISELLLQIIRQQIVLELINSLLGLISQFFETEPDQHARAQVIALRTIQPALTTLNASHLFLFAMKLLNLPPMTTLLLSRIGL